MASQNVVVIAELATQLEKALTNMAGQKKPFKALMDSYKNFALDSVGAGRPPRSETGSEKKDKHAEDNP